ncbi:hypothetical protein V6Z12_A12G183000 [Gossypium hirsutum]
MINYLCKALIYSQIHKGKMKVPISTLIRARQATIRHPAKRLQQYILSSPSVTNCHDTSNEYLILNIKLKQKLSRTSCKGSKERTKSSNTKRKKNKKNYSVSSALLGEH